MLLFPKNLIANNHSTPGLPLVLVYLLILVGLNVPAEARTQRRRDLSTTDVFLLMLKVGALCWPSLPGFLSPLTCRPLCLRDPHRVLPSLHKLGVGCNNETCLNFLTLKSKAFCVCVAEEHSFRCEDCDELFQSKLDLRRHKKYACSAVSSLYESLSDEIKQEGLGDGQVYECKDCERMFPNKYRYHTVARPSPACSSPCLLRGPSGDGQCRTRWELGGSDLSILRRVKECWV